MVAGTGDRIGTRLPAERSAAVLSRAGRGGWAAGAARGTAGGTRRAHRAPRDALELGRGPEKSRGSAAEAHGEAPVASETYSGISRPPPVMKRRPSGQRSRVRGDAADESDSARRHHAAASAAARR